MTIGLMNGEAAPFASPFVDLSDQAVEQLALHAKPVLGSAAVRSLSYGLANELAAIAAPVMLDAYARFPGRSSIDSGRTGDHDQFNSWLGDAGLSELLAAHPELHRIVTTHITRWQSLTDELVDRLRADRRLLADRLDFHLPITDFVPLIGGSAVLTDGDGTEIVVKNRAVDVDAAFFELLRSINLHGPGPELSTLMIVDKAHYGYVSYAEHRPPVTDDQRRAYLQRAGMLVALATVLGSTDLHARNIHIDGEWPVLVDGETILRPPWRIDDENKGPSVFSTGWVPVQGHVELCGLAAEVVGPRPSAWCDIGTDAVRQRPATPTKMRERVRITDDLARGGTDTVEYTVAGFCCMYDYLASSGVDLSPFLETNPRVILRPSWFYEDVMLRSLAPDAVRSRDARIAILDSATVSPPTSLSKSPTLAGRLRPAERGAIDELTFPRFTMPAGGGSLRLDNVDLGPSGLTAPLAQTRRFLRSMSPDDRDRHVADIRSALEPLLDRTQSPERQH